MSNVLEMFDVTESHIVELGTVHQDGENGESVRMFGSYGEAVVFRVVVDHVELGLGPSVVDEMLTPACIVFAPVEVELLEDVDIVQASVTDEWEIVVLFVLLQLEHN